MRRFRRCAGRCSSSRRAPRRSRRCTQRCSAWRSLLVVALADLDGRELLPRARAGAAVARAAGRRGADRRRRSRPPHRGAHRRRARGAGRAVQPHERGSCASRTPASSARSSSAPPSSPMRSSSQTATGEVLRVISGSVADSVPVFEKILRELRSPVREQRAGHPADRRRRPGASGGAPRPRARAPGGHVPVGADRRLPDPAARARRPALQGRPRRRRRPSGIRAIAEQLGIGSYSQVFAPMVWKGQAIGTLVRHAPAADRLLRQGGRAAAHLRRPGGDRDPERAPVQRDARGAAQGRAAHRRAAARRSSQIGDQRRCCASSASRRRDVAPVFEAILDSASACSAARSGERLPRRRRSSSSRRRATGRRGDCGAIRCYPCAAEHGDA